MLVLSSILDVLFACARVNAEARLEWTLFRVQNMPADKIVLPGGSD